MPPVIATMRNVGRSGALAAAAGPVLGRTLEIKQLDVCDEGSIRACLDSIPGRHIDILGEPRDSLPTMNPALGPSMMEAPVLGAVQPSLSHAGDHLCIQHWDPPCQGHLMTLTPCTRGCPCQGPPARGDPLCWGISCTRNPPNSGHPILGTL